MMSPLFSCVLILQFLAVFAAVKSVNWEDTDLTSKLWGICSNHNTEALIEVLSDQSIVPPAAFARAKDGRGPLFWAYEYGFSEGIQILEQIGVSPNDEDANGKTPRQLGEENAEAIKTRRSREAGGFSTGGSNEFSDDHYGAEDEDYGDVYDDGEDEF